MFAPLARVSNKMGRNVMTTMVRNHSHGGVPGENLPFDINNRYKLTVYFIGFFGSGLAAPYLICRHQLLKKRIAYARGFARVEFGYYPTRSYYRDKK